MANFDFQIYKNGIKVDNNQAKLLARIAEIDPSKAVLNDININRDNIMFRLNEVVGLNQNLDQSEVANYYENDTLQDQFVSNFLSGLDGDYNIDSSMLNPQYRHMHSEYGDALVLNEVENNNLTGEASQAVLDFLAGLA